MDRNSGRKVMPARKRVNMAQSETEFKYAEYDGHIYRWVVEASRITGLSALLLGERAGGIMGKLAEECIRS